MKSKKTETIIAEIREFLKAEGWSMKPRSNHLYKEGPLGDEQRMNFQATSLRYESKVNHTDGTYTWVRLASNYYSKLSVAGNKLVGLKR